jgi:hypothetical protein
MRKADKQRKSERKKLERHRQKYIRKEKKLAKKQQKQLKRSMSGWKKTKKAKKFQISKWFRFNKKAPKQKGTTRLGSRFDLIGKTISKKVRQFRKKKEQVKTPQEAGSIHLKIRKPFFTRLSLNLQKFFSKLFPKKTKHEERLIHKQLKKESVKSQLPLIIRLPYILVFQITRLLTPKQKRATLKQYTLGSWDSRYFIGVFLRIREVRVEFLKSVFNSTTLFILAFLVIYYINNYITIYTAQFYDIPTVLYSYRIFWPLYTYSSLYTRQALVVTFGMGPFICFVLAILFLQVLRWLKKYNLNLKLFALWLSFHAFNSVFGGYLAGIITRTGSMYAVEWLFLTAVFNRTEIILLIITIISMFILGYFATSYFLMAVNAKVIRESKYRIYFLIGNVAIPWILGNLSLFLLNLPNNPTELMLLYASSILLVIPIFSNYNSPMIQMMKFERIAGNMKMAWAYLLLAIAAFVFIRMFIYDGISYG